MDTDTRSWHVAGRGRSRLAAGVLGVVIMTLASCSSSAPSPRASSPGVTKSTISIGLDVPITGIGFSLGSGVEKQAQLYWKWEAAHGKKIVGRTVQLSVHNDQFSSSVATQVCASEAPNSFIMLGWQGSNVIGACAQYANSQGVPYIARGLDAAFGKYRTYFALSPSYPHEGELVARWMRQHMGARPGSKVGFITYNTSEFNGLNNAFSAEARSLGLTVVPAQRISLTAGIAESQAAALAMKNSAAQYVYLDLAKQMFTVLSTFQAQSYYPHIVLYGANAEAKAICGLLGPNKADVYAPSPAPELDYARAHDPNFFKAWSEYIGGQPTDIGLYFWWEMKAVAAMLETTGNPLTRARFIQRVEHSTIATTLMAPIHYTAADHIAATKEWMLRLDCTSGQFLTAANVSSGA